MTTMTIEERLAAKADTVRRDFRDRVEQLRDWRELNDEARRSRIARAFLDARTELHALRDREATSTAAEVERLRRQHFGLSASGDTLTFRDARDRVRALDLGDLPTVLAESESVGDTVLARAVLERAMRERDLTTINLWVERHPRDEGDLQRLYDLTDTSLGRDVLAAVFRYDVDPPAELAGLADDQLERLADGRPTTAAS